MNPVTRGMRNAFRNGIRTGSIVLILGLSIGLSLTMLIAQKAVDTKIASVKSSIGNTVSIAPAGFTPGSQQNNALTTTELAKVAKLDHVSSVTETLADRLSTTGSTTASFGPMRDSSNSSSTTSLNSPVTFSGGPRFMSGGTSDSTSSTSTFSLPVSFVGSTATTSINGTAITLKSGKAIDGSADTNTVLISQEMATKNNLSVGSTFTAYNTTLTVAGIFSASTQNARNTVILSLASLQRLSGQSGVVTSAVANVDSLDNLSSVTSAVKSTLGSSTADVTSAEDQANQTVAPLNSVKKVTTFSLIGAIAAGAVIILLVTVMVVRERKREIGVVKAIGGSNIRIVTEFMVESLTLAILGAVIGLIIGVVGGQPVTKQLVSSSTSSNTMSQMGPRGIATPGTGGERRSFGEGLRRNSTVRSFSNIKAQVGPAILLEGFGAAVLIAVIGSALSAGMISRVRPASVMRTE